MRLKDEEKNIAIRTLHNDPEEFVRKHVFPYEVTCKNCKIEQVLDMPSDLYADRDKEGQWRLFHSCLVCHTRTVFEPTAYYGMSGPQRNRNQAIYEGQDKILNYYKSLIPPRKLFLAEYEGLLVTITVIILTSIIPTIRGIFYNGWEDFFTALMIEFMLGLIVMFILVIISD